MSFFSFIFLVGLTLLIPFCFPAFSQIRGGDAEDFFEEGNQQMEQNIQNLQNESSPESREGEEEKLEQQLNIEQVNPREPKVQEVPSPSLGDGDNVPTPPPEGEVQIKTP